MPIINLYLPDNLFFFAVVIFVYTYTYFTVFVLNVFTLYNKIKLIRLEELSVSTKKKIKVFIALLSLLYCVSLIQTTYAKYVTAADATTNIAIARWNVLVNNQDIKNSSNFSSNVKPVFTGNDNIADGYIAPTSTGYFDITLDGTSTDVSFSYTITIENTSDQPIKDLKIVNYNVDSSQTNTEFSTAGIITGNVLMSDTKRSHTFRIYLNWNDDTTTQTMDNDADTNATSNTSTALKVSINLVQKAN